MVRRRLKERLNVEENRSFKASLTVQCRKVLEKHLVALISLVVAVVALTFNTHRANQTEYQRNIRSAGFEVLHELSELQLLIDYAHYGSDDRPVSPITGWARVNYMRDLATVIPMPVPQTLDSLFLTWSEEIDHLDIAANASVAQRERSLEGNKRISAKISATRDAVKRILQSLE